MKIGAMVESFRKDFREGIETAASLGVDGVQAYMTNWGELKLDELTPAKLKNALDIVKSNGLVFSAICGDFGYSFNNEETNAEYVDKSKRVLTYAKELECNVVTTHVGHIPAEECKEKEIMRKAMRELAEYADNIGSAFACETGTEKAVVLGDFLDSLGANGVRVNFDPANLVMCSDDRPETAVETLAKYIVHTHAKDGIMLGDNLRSDIVVTIGDEAKGHDELLKMGQAYLELPLGDGDVNFDLYLPALAKTGFDGFLTIEREVGDSPEKDIALAVSFLKEKLAKFNL